MVNTCLFDNGYDVNSFYCMQVCESAFAQHTTVTTQHASHSTVCPHAYMHTHKHMLFGAC